jgi:sugar/nucleoside kinase (ribokinase family)
MDKTIKISGTGCALVDYLYKPVDFSSKAITPYLSVKAGDGGLTPGKLVFTEELELFAHEKYLSMRDNVVNHKKPVALNIGGPSIVSLIHAAQLLHNQPAEIRFWGCKGKDEGSIFLDEKLRETPLKIGKYKKGKSHTPFTDVFSDPDFDQGNGERIFVNNIGAAWEFLPSDLDESFFDANIVVFGGTALVPAIHDHLTELLREAKEKGCITIVNTVYDFRNEKANPDRRWPMGKSDDSYSLIDLLITDNEEAQRLSGERNIQQAIRFFLDKKVSSLIITNGSKNIYAFSDGQFCKALELTEYPVSEKVSEELKSNTTGDTTGCGDNFAGGVIASLAAQLHSGIQLPNLTEACCWGVVSGGYTCFYIGGTYLEDFSGEKLQKLNPYYELYKKQLGD